MADKLCPLLKKSCVEHQCRWYIQVMGKNPQTGQDVNQWGCAIEWMPMLLIDNTQQHRQTGAAVESARNEAVKRADTGIAQMAVLLKIVSDPDTRAVPYGGETPLILALPAHSS